MKHWYQSKTIRIAILQAIAGVLIAVFSNYPELQNVGYMAVFKSVIDFILRVQTTDKVI